MADHVIHKFGGDWTAEKLERIRKYLPAYTTILSRNATASRYFRTMYIDAFAGTGYVDSATQDPTDFVYNFFDNQNTEVEPITLPEAKIFLDGSARIALETEPAFDRYVFIEKSRRHVQQLEELRNAYPDKADRIEVIQGEANAELMKLIDCTNWRQWRAIVFLDPYGMQVNWELIERIAKTKAIDLWILFPLGQAVNRVLTKNQPPPDHWARGLDRFFGNNDWLQRFYREDKFVQINMFDDSPEPEMRKVADFADIGQYFIERLQSVFPHVAPNALPLVSSGNIPLYLLCFAAHH